MFTYSDTLRTARANLLATAIDSGSAGPATLTIYTGPRPAPGAAVTSQVLLVAMQFTHPCAQSVTGGVLTLKPLSEKMVTGNGVQTWGRLANRDGVFIADLDVGPPGSGADIEIPANELYAGAMVRINNATFTEP